MATKVDQKHCIVEACTYTVWRLLGSNVFFCFLLEVQVTFWAVQELLYQPNQWNA